jgi:hypothetical protein
LQTAQSVKKVFGIVRVATLTLYSGSTVIGATDRRFGRFSLCVLPPASRWARGNKVVFRQKQVFDGLSRSEKYLQTCLITRLLLAEKRYY